MKTKEVYDGFEGEELSDIWSRSKFVEEAVKLQSKIVRMGEKAVRVTIKKGDKAEEGGNGKMTERDELLERKDLYSEENKNYIYSFSLYLPKNFPTVSTRLVLAQWKQRDEDDKAIINNPLIALRYTSGEFLISLQTTEKRFSLYSTKEEIRGKWVDFKFKIKFTRTKKGILKVWMNKKKIVDYKGTTAYSENYGYPKNGKFYFKMGLYRDEMKEPMTAYFDEYKKRWLEK